MEFIYTARDKKGKLVSAQAYADSVPILVSRLKNDGLLPLSVEEAGTRISWKLILMRSRISQRELAIFSRQLAASLDAGIVLLEALQTIGEDLENTYFRKVLQVMVKDIEGGLNFSSALAKYRDVFPMTFVAVVRAGEESGKLDKTLLNLAAYLEEMERLTQKMKSAMRYPMFIFGFFIFVVFTIVFFLIPKFKTMFTQAGARLPLLTRVVVGISEFMMSNILWILMFLGLCICLFWLLLRSPEIRFRFDALKLKIPLFGKIIQKSLISRFCWTLSILLSGGVGLITSLPICAEVSNNIYLREVIHKVKERIVAGATMSSELKNHRVFPKLVTKMVQVGERTGRLSEMLQRNADYYDEELRIVLENFTALLEPMLIILIGCVVLIVVLALYLPIFKMSMAAR